MVKETINKMKRLPTEWEKNILSHKLSDWKGIKIKNIQTAHEKKWLLKWKDIENKWKKSIKMY